MESEYQQINPRRSFFWVLPLVFSCVFFAIGLFFLGEGVNYPFQINGIISLSYLLFAIYLSFIKFMIFLLKHQRLPKLKDSSLLQPGLHGQLKLNSKIYILILSGVFAFLVAFTSHLGWYFNPESQGVIQAISNGNPVLSLLLAYWWYGQKINLIELFGIVTSIGGLIIIAIDDGVQGTILAFLFALSTFLFLALRNVICRGIARAGFDSGTASIVTAFIVAVCGFGMMAVRGCMGYEYFQGDFDFNMVVVGALFMPMGVYLATVGIMIGKTGPSIAIVNSCGVFLLGLNAVFRGIIPSYMKMIGCGFVFVGVLVSVVGSSFIKLIVK